MTNTYVCIVNNPLRYNIFHNYTSDENYQTYLVFAQFVPESYREDYLHAKEFFDNKDDEQMFYVNMKSGAESGWDYSTKWQVK